MGSVYHEEAAQALADMAGKVTDHDSFVAFLDERFLGWRNDAVPTKGYMDQHHHVSLIVSRSLHDVLPSPYNAMRYQYELAHGFGVVLSYVEAQATQAKDIDALVDRAAEECVRVAN